MFNKFIFNQILKRLDNIKFGSLKIEDPDGKIHAFKGDLEGPNADLKFKDWDVVGNLARKSDIGFAEDYSRNLWDTSDLVALITVSMQNRAVLDPFFEADTLRKFFYHLTYFFRQNSLKGSKKNIHAHYDLGNDFYKLWLDETMTYSSAIYEGDKDDLVMAQTRKYDRIIDKLDSASGNVLEIGCGWGGFADQALQRSKDYKIKGITLSNEQHEYAQKRLNGDANIVIEDYRHQEGKYDHIVSIEMFEAVGEKYWPSYFSKIKELLKPEGKAIVQTITIEDKSFERYKRGSDFIRSHIFPGGLLPSPSRFDEETHKAGLTSMKVFEFGQDYAKTLEQWLHNFDDVYDKVKNMGFDDGFIRMWRFYLAGCAAAFRTGFTNVRQVEIGHAS